MAGCDTKWMSHLTLRDVTLRTSVTYGGPAAPREATTAVTFAKMVDFLPIADVHHGCVSGQWFGTNKGCHLLAAGATSDSPLVHLDYLLIAAVYTLITFVFQVIGVYPYCNHLWMVILTPCSPQFTFRHSLRPPLIWPMKQEDAKFLTCVCKDIQKSKEVFCVAASKYRSFWSFKMISAS